MGKNGHIHNGKQNNICRDCGRNFVENPDWSLIDARIVEQINRALNERLPLRGICRVFGVAMSWLMKHIEDLFSAQPHDLGTWIPDEAHTPKGFVIAIEADELCI